MGGGGRGYPGNEVLGDNETGEANMAHSTASLAVICSPYFTEFQASPSQSSIQLLHLSYILFPLGLPEAPLNTQSGWTETLGSALLLPL